MAGEENERTPKRRERDRSTEAAGQNSPKRSAGASLEQPPVPPETRPEEPEPVEPPHDRAPCRVVGVGASAGGLEALQGLFANLPPKPGIAFVVVQHRTTDRTSVMKSLIEKYTKLRVEDIADNTNVQPDTIYLAPAEKDVSIMHGVLFLTDVPPHFGVHLPIDSFLRTLAQDEAERAICIILSGTGSDGTLGLREVKAAGGMAMAQKEDQAKYDSMPRSAIDTGMVDFVLPVEKMGEQLAQYVRHPYLERRKPPESEEKAESQLQKVFLLIRNQTGHDFSHYKRNTIRRRIARRLAVHQIEDLEHYVKLLQENSEEVALLAREMLITVTNFVRDPEAWDALQENVIRLLVEEKPPEIPLRIWVAGCATGEEAYTVAILFQEEVAKNERHRPVQIFATDLDEESINVARRGIYPKSIAADVSATRLKRFFTEEGNSYKIKNNIRESIVFAKHNLVKDAPFSKLDLVCCRNVLIYMDNSLQKKLIPMFHYTLNPGAYLFLGESESIGVFADLFGSVAAKSKIFKRKPIETGYEAERVEVSDHHYLETDIVARPVDATGEGGELMLVVFKSRPKEQKPDAGGPAPAQVPEGEKDARIREVEQELQSAREYLQTTIEELETSNEELQSTNEELQSTNEELRTVNAEHQQKIEELSKVYDDQKNLLQTTDVATLFLDKDRQVPEDRPAHPAAQRPPDHVQGRGHGPHPPGLRGYHRTTEERIGEERIGVE